MDAATSSQAVESDHDVLLKASAAAAAVASGTAASIAANVAISPHGSAINQLLLQDHNQPTWATTYTVPLYSSFGNHLGAYESDNLRGTLNDFNRRELEAQLSFDSSLGFASYQSDKLSLSEGLIGRPSDENERNIFSNSKTNNPSRSNQQQQQQQQQRRVYEFLSPTKSYSSVLHSQVAPRGQQQEGQMSNLFESHQQQQLPNSGLDLNQSNLIAQPINRQQQNNSFTQFHHQPQIPPSRPQQQQQQQQVRHLSDSLASMNQQQQTYLGATSPSHQQQRVNTLGGVLENFGSIGGGSNLDNRHHHHQQQRSSQPTNMPQRQSMNQENKPFPGQAGSGQMKRKNKLPFFPVSSSSSDGQSSLRLDLYNSSLVNSDNGERFSRKVFVGGLPPDIDEEEIKISFRRFGLLIVDWPHKAESKSYFPPKGYAFLLFQEESSVQALIDACLQEDDKLYLCVSSPTIKDKPVQIRPWRLSDSDFVLDSTLALDPRKTVFVGGVPRPLKASELATIMNNLYNNVCYAGIDTDPDLKYPKGAGRVAFSNHQSYIAAISARFVHIRHSEFEKRVEVKPYVLDDQFCDECQGAKCNNKFAPFFCGNITCLRYYCDNCWFAVHSQPGREFHKPLVKEGADRPRGPGIHSGGVGSSARNNSGTIGDNSRKISSGNSNNTNTTGGGGSGGESSSTIGTQHQSFRW